MNFHSQLEDKSRLIYELEIKVGAPEEKLKSALSEKGSLGDYWYKQGRVEGLRIGADLGFDKGYHAAHAAFPQSRDMENLVEAYRQRISQHTWHSMLFLKETLGWLNLTRRRCVDVLRHSEQGSS